MNSPLALFNGTFMPLSQVTVPALDRGYLFGDGVYEVVRIYERVPFCFEAHLARLARSLDAMNMDGVNLTSLNSQWRLLIENANLKEATLYLQITRGVAPRAHAFPENSQPNQLAFVSEFVDRYATFRKRGCAVITHPEIRWGRCDIKSLNLLGNVFAAEAAKRANVLEAIFVQKDGLVTEGSHTSLFAIIQGTLRTMPKGNAILPGITREIVLKLAYSLALPVEERAFTLEELKIADEAFLTATTTEIIPIVEIDSLPLGKGNPGPLTQQLQQAFEDFRNKKLTLS